MARVLIIDDSTVQRTIFRKYLERVGHEIVGEAKGGTPAVELYISLKPDIVILDIVMPDANGMAILGQIMSYDSNANVIMCSVAALQNIIIESIQMGAKGFLVKPVTSDALLSNINKIMQRQKV
jgi:two-component system chemotaxis response regulator CheY